MAIFTNQATLVYNGGSANSNIAVGEILEVLSADKTAVEGSYAPGELVTYVITIRNTGTAAFTGLTVTDDLGGGANAPLTYEAGTALYFVNGVLQATPTVTAGPPLVFTGITVPGNGDAVIVYQARANSFAAPGVDGTITNTVTITGGGLTAPVTATETVTVRVEALERFHSFAELYAALDPAELGYGPGEAADPRDMEVYYSPTQQEKYGVVGIRVRLV